MYFSEELYVGTLSMVYIRMNTMLKEASEVEYVWLLFSVSVIPYVEHFMMFH